MRLLALLVVGFSPLLAGSVRLGGQQDAGSEVSDQSFWSAQWRMLEGDLTRLQSQASLLEVKSSTGNATTVKKPAAPTALRASKGSGDATDPMAKAAALRASKGDAADPMAKVQGMMKGLMGKAMLMPMLEMMKGMYQDQKKRIGDLNKREQLSKKRYEQQSAEHDKHIQGVKDKFDQHKLSEGFYKNATHDYDRQFKYWVGVRSRNKRQYHNALKITHGMMAREKDMIAQYDNAMKMPDHKGKSGSKAPEAAATVAPEVVLQQFAETSKFCERVLLQVRSELETAPVSNVIGLYADKVF